MAGYLAAGRYHVELSAVKGAKTMDFRDHMLELGRYGPGENWRHIPAGNHRISVQASRRHYCSPRVDSDDPFTYSEFEVAIAGTNGRIDRSFGDMGVRGYVPVAEVQDIIWEYVKRGTRE